MWHRLQNFVYSLSTYRDLSPDLCIRRHVIRRLSDRPSLSFPDWYWRHCQPLNISRPVAQFAYQHLSHYSGLPFGRVVLSDRLEEDLHWSEVCWHDWQFTLCEEFMQQFGIDLSDRLFDWEPHTLEDLMHLLNQTQPENL